MRFSTGVAVASLFLASTARSDEWLQRYHDAQHSSSISGTVNPLSRVVFRYIFDPSQVNVGEGDILVHYSDMLLHSNGDKISIFRDVAGGTITYGVRSILNSGRI